MTVCWNSLLQCTFCSQASSVMMACPVLYSNMFLCKLISNLDFPTMSSDFGFLNLQKRLNACLLLPKRLRTPMQSSMTLCMHSTYLNIGLIQGAACLYYTCWANQDCAYNNLAIWRLEVCQKAACPWRSTLLCINRPAKMLGEACGQAAGGRSTRSNSQTTPTKTTGDVAKPSHLYLPCNCLTSCCTCCSQWCLFPELSRTI